MNLSDLPDDWQHADIDAILPLVLKRGLAIDCGAHRGIVTRKLLQHFERVVAIEPGSLADRIEGAEVVRAALGAEPGFCGLEDNVGGNTGQRHCVPVGWTPVITLDSLGLAPDFIKMDVEGMEHFVLRGGEQTIRTHRPVIMLEENGLNRRYGVPDNECKRLLESWGAAHVMTLHEDKEDTDQVFAWSIDAPDSKQ